MSIERLSVHTQSEPCDHYWLVRRGGKCPTCGRQFQENFGDFFRAEPQFDDVVAALGIDVPALGRSILDRAEASGKALQESLKKVR